MEFMKNAYEYPNEKGSAIRRSPCSVSKNLSVGATLGRPRILQSKIPSPQGENTVISLREIRKTPFSAGDHGSPLQASLQNEVL